MRRSKLSLRTRADLAALSTSPVARRLVDKTGFEAPTLERFESAYLADYQPHAKQQELHEHIDTRFAAVVAGRRGGKTYGCGREFLRRVWRDVEAKKARGETWTRPKTLDKEAKVLGSLFVALVGTIAFVLLPSRLLIYMGR